MMAPAELASRRQWLVWKFIQKPGDKKPSKIPFYATTGNPRGWPNGKPRDGKPTDDQPQVDQGHELDRQHLVTFDEAVQAVTGRFDGVGIAFLPGDGLIGVDLDGMVDPDTGEISERASKVIGVFGTYTEYSPSGTGFHIIGYGQTQTNKSNDIGVEMFCGRQFFTWTGQAFNDNQVTTIPEKAIVGLHAWINRAKEEARQARQPAAPAQPASTMPAAVQTDDRANKYVMGALNKACQVIATTSEGGRNNLLNEEAFQIAGYVGAGLISEAMAYQALFEAARQCGLTDVEITPTLQSAFRAGKQVPKQVPAPDPARAPRQQRQQVAQQPEPPAPAQSPANDNDPITAMISEWSFVASQRKFIHVPTMRMVDVDAFNLQYIHLMASIPEAKKMKPAEYVRRVINGKVVHDLMYLPTAWNGDPFFTVDGVDYLNTYNTKSVPEVASDWQQHDAWQICLDHLKNIMPNDWEQLLFWMAHNVQQPGRKILWAPVIVGMPGDGKTTIAKMISAAIGYKHTKVVGPEALNSDFNGWAEGSCVTTFEEIRAKGHSRHDFMNKLKPLITNEVVDIVSKGKNSRNVANTQNYLALSNYRDALVLDSDDRRWGVFFTRFLSRSQVEREMDEVYWSRLNDYAIRDNPGVIRGWLLNVDLSSFNPNRGPGMTEAKRFMIMNSLSSDAQSVAEVIGAGSHGVNSTVVETKSLNSALREYEGRSMQTSRLSAALKELGFTKVEKTIKWNGRPCWIWTRSPFVYDDSVECRERIRLALEEHKSKAEFVPPWLNTN